MLEYSTVKFVMCWAKLFEGKWKDYGVGIIGLKDECTGLFPNWQTYFYQKY